MAIFCYYSVIDPDSRPMSRQGGDFSEYSRQTIQTKIAALFSQKKSTGILELEMMDSFRTWMEEAKGDEYHRFQTFDLVFSTKGVRILRGPRKNSKTGGKK